MTVDLIPFQIETQRVIQLLSKQIYQSPLALLRENAQNAFDAIRLRMHENRAFNPRIEIELATNRIAISDNGIGMTPNDLDKHFWTAGSSSKNTEAARAAGVVGTFGIGAMANFGIADRLVVETESAVSGERTICKADRAKLSINDPCIEREIVAPTGEPGTRVVAEIPAGSEINVAQAQNYISEFLSLVDVPVFVNGQLVSQKAIDESVPIVPETWRMERADSRIGDRLLADVVLVLSNNADIWLKLTKLSWSGQSIAGQILLRSGQSTLRTFRSGFGLATASVSSHYQFGGVADLLLLEPTAGREAITTEGLQFLQSVVAEIDGFISLVLAERDESDVSTPFMNWVISHGRFEMCSRLKMSVNPGERIFLSDVATRSQDQPMLLYEGSDDGIIKMHASDDRPLLVLARSNPRRRCEQGFLQARAKIEKISDNPVIKDRRIKSQFSIEESAFAFRVESILETDYFVSSEIEFGTISHGLPLLVAKNEGSDILRIVLNPTGQTISLIFGLYNTDFAAFGSMTKDFVRTIVFPRISDFVPSSTRQGAEAFLKAIRRPRELFEYADDDLGDLPRIWEDYTSGRIPLAQAVERSKSAVRAGVQFIDSAASARDVVPDVIQNEQTLLSASVEGQNSLDASPAITRLETRTSAKLLVIAENEPALRGYRCFIALSDRVREEMGEFFLQPHRTSIVWGGQKTLFIFLHHSGQFGLYYDLQTREPVDAPAGGGAFPTASIILKDRLFIPIPDLIRASFIPQSNERKRFDVRADILRTEVG